MSMPEQDQKKMDATRAEAAALIEGEENRPKPGVVWHEYALACSPRGERWRKRDKDKAKARCNACFRHWRAELMNDKECRRKRRHPITRRLVRIRCLVVE